jgi:aspartate dehydrogenase
MSQPRQPDPTRIALAGLGAIGTAVAARLARDEVPGALLAAVAARDEAKARRTLDALGSGATVLPIADLADAADLVIECAPAALLDEIVRPVLLAGKTAMVLGVGALLSRPELIGLAKAHGGRIVIPSGAILGLDAVLAAAEGRIESVRMITRKPPGGLVGAPYLTQRGINLDALTEPLLLFQGSAREAATGFPANLNVAAALSLAGIGPDRTEVEVWADPGVKRNTHRIVVESDAARLDMTIENVPSENPRTGRITALSVIACLRKMHAPLRVGT